jgi:hypothetical protein
MDTQLMLHTVTVIPPMVLMDITSLERERLKLLLAMVMVTDMDTQHMLHTDTDIPPMVDTVTILARETLRLLQLLKLRHLQDTVTVMAMVMVSLMEATDMVMATQHTELMVTTMDKNPTFFSC